MAIREKYIEKLVELFRAYMKSGKSLDTFEEVRYQASQLGKKLFKEKVPLDWIIGLYIEAVRRLKREARREEALDLASCGNLLLEMVMAYSINFLRNVEIRERLRESQERFRRIAERSFDALFTLDLSRRITYASPAAERIGRRRLKDITGKPFHSFVHESDMPKTIQALSKVLKGETIDALEIKLLRGDGSLVNVEVNASPIIRDGEVVGVEGIFRDITERKKLERLRRNLRRGREGKNPGTSYTNMAFLNL